jgi:hypothetical protein
MVRRSTMTTSWGSPVLSPYAPQYLPQQAPSSTETHESVASHCCPIHFSETERKFTVLQAKEIIYLGALEPKV